VISWPLRIEEDNEAKKNLGGSHNFLDAFKDIRVWALAVVYFCGVVGFYAVNFWMPTLIQELGVDKKDFLKGRSAQHDPVGCRGGGDGPGGFALRPHRRAPLARGRQLLVAALGMLMLALVGKAPIPGMIGLTLVTSGVLSYVATFWSLPTAFLSGTAAAAGIAWINSVGNLGGHFGPDMIGRIRQATNSTEAAFYALAALALLGAIITIMMPKAEKR
jgi:nitrate/nitrite transporter NarK